MPQAAPLPFATYLNLIGPLVADTAAALGQVAPDAAVPGCPDWSASELRDHCGGVLAFWIHQLRLADASATGPNFDGEVRERFRLPLEELGPELVAELSASGADRPCWNWSGGNFTSSWAARRMTQEFAVHRCDALATADMAVGIDADLASDGINELIDVFVGPRGDESSPVMVGVLELASSDRGRWLLDIGTDGVATADDGTAPNASVKGPVDQILLHLWDRPASVEQSGDPNVMDAWRRLARFD